MCVGVVGKGMKAYNSTKRIVTDLIDKEGMIIDADIKSQIIQLKENNNDLREELLEKDEFIRELKVRDDLRSSFIFDSKSGVYEAINEEDGNVYCPKCMDTKDRAVPMRDVPARNFWRCGACGINHPQEFGKPSQSISRRVLTRR